MMEWAFIYIGLLAGTWTVANYAMQWHNKRPDKPKDDLDVTIQEIMAKMPMPPVKESPIFMLGLADKHGCELRGGGYVRRPLPLNIMYNRATKKLVLRNAEAIVFPRATESWAVVDQCLVVAPDGHVVTGGPVNGQRSVSVSEVFSFPKDDFSIEIGWHQRSSSEG
jgi:hypothetical protein